MTHMGGKGGGGAGRAWGKDLDDPPQVGPVDYRPHRNRGGPREEIKGGTWL